MFWPFKRKNRIVKKLEKVLKVIPNDFALLKLDLNSIKFKLIKDLEDNKLIGEKKDEDQIELFWFKHAASALNNYLNEDVDSQKWKKKFDRIWFKR